MMEITIQMGDDLLYNIRDHLSKIGVQHPEHEAHQIMHLIAMAETIDVEAEAQHNFYNDCCIGHLGAR